MGTAPAQHRRSENRSSPRRGRQAAGLPAKPCGPTGTFHAMKEFTYVTNLIHYFSQCAVAAQQILAPPSCATNGFSDSHHKA
jgi:hypothetical protein